MALTRKNKRSGLRKSLMRKRSMKKRSMKKRSTRKTIRRSRRRRTVKTGGFGRSDAKKRAEELLKPTGRPEYENYYNVDFYNIYHNNKSIDVDDDETLKKVLTPVAQKLVDDGIVEREQLHQTLKDKNGNKINNPDCIFHGINGGDKAYGLADFLVNGYQYYVKRYKWLEANPELDLSDPNAPVDDNPPEDFNKSLRKRNNEEKKRKAEEQEFQPYEDAEGATHI